MNAPGVSAVPGDASDAERRAALSEGRSNDPVYELVCRVLDEAAPRAGTLVDVGCGSGALAGALGRRVARYVGCDVVRYPQFPAGAEFVKADLNQAPYPVPDASADVVACVETIEHLENPRMVFRELSRIVRPGGLVLVTTPNVLSLLGKLTFVLKNGFQAFQDGEYPAHITPVAERDLVRIGAECGLEGLFVRFTDRGRVPLLARHWPARLGFRGRAFSDNVLVAGRRAR